MTSEQPSLADAHLHLDFVEDPTRFVADTRRAGLDVFANTVTPAGFALLRQMMHADPHVHVGLGLHPWWVESAHLDEFDRLEPSTRWIGEVGLDFSPKRAAHELQLEVFRHIALRCARAGKKVLSIHAVRSVTAVLDVLEDTGCLDSCTCILHWFSGSTDELWRAIRAGCWFSVNRMQASTRRAKEQLKLIPAQRLLLETDLPEFDGQALSVEDAAASLHKAQTLLEAIRGELLDEQLLANWHALAR